MLPISSELSHAQECWGSFSGAGESAELSADQKISLVIYASAYIREQMTRTDFIFHEVHLDLDLGPLADLGERLRAPNWESLCSEILSHSFKNNQRIRLANMARFNVIEGLLFRDETPYLEGTLRVTLRKASSGAIERVCYYPAERHVTNYYQNGATSEARLDERGIVTGTRYDDGGGNVLILTGQKTSHYVLQNPFGYCVIDIHNGDLLELGDMKGNWRSRDGTRYLP